MAQALKVSRSGFHAWHSRPQSDRDSANADLLQKIKKVYQDSRRTYGSPRVTAELRSQGVSCSRNRVAKLMKCNGIAAKTKRRFRVTTNSRHRHPVAPNLIGKNFSVGHPNRIWTSDITYIRTQEGWMYLAVILDLYSRSVVGWSMKKRLNCNLTMDAIRQALLRRRPGKGLIFHSDQGVQYASAEFRGILKELKITQSMSGKGNCYDNAVAESFFHTLKTELVYFEIYKTRDEAKQSIFDYIEVFYNRRRLHSSLGFLAPAEFEIANKTT